MPDDTVRRLGKRDKKQKPLTFALFDEPEIMRYRLGDAMAGTDEIGDELVEAAIEDLRDTGIGQARVRLVQQ